MPKNIGTIDRVLRVIVGFALLAFASGLILPDTGWNALGWIGVVPILTAVVRFCPAYTLIGVSTSKDA